MKKMHGGNTSSRRARQRKSNSAKAVRRKTRALQYLEHQLETGVKIQTLGRGQFAKQTIELPLTEKDVERIKKEIKILNTKLVGYAK